MIGLIDVGSTFTKITVVDLDRENVVFTSKAPTTIDTSVMVGYKNALSQILASGIEERDLTYIGSSSAAGGLQMVAIGLVPGLTAEAAKRAALGAGAKVIGTFSYELANVDLKQIKKLNPDIILLAGGTDGGNKDVALSNARKLAASDINAPVVYAGNRAASDEIADLYRSTGKNLRITENVLPELNTLNVDPVRKVISEVFIEQIVEAKGLSELNKIAVHPLIPTPTAVLEACRLLAGGFEDEKGLGEIVLIDIGGATTDIYSASAGLPTRAGVVPKGLPEPFLKRTVEGDLGVRYNARTILELAGAEKVVQYCGVPLDQMESIVAKIATDTSSVPACEAEYAVDRGLAVSAIQMAVQRHSGYMQVYYTPAGEAYVQYGKDLSQVRTVVATGGVLVHSPEPGNIIAGALSGITDPFSLAPRKADLYLDSLYILYAVGLLSRVNPLKALRIGKKYLRPVH